MKAKKVMALALTAAMTMGMATTAFAAEDNTHIYVLTASEDHGWTGSVATFAKEKVEEINGEGTYSAEVITAASASDQITQIEDILAGDTDNIAIVVQPLDDTVQSAIQQIVDAEVPYVAFDRIIDAVSSTAVSNVKGDNSGIGSGAAAYFVEKDQKRHQRPRQARSKAALHDGARRTGNIADHMEKPVHNAECDLFRDAFTNKSKSVLSKLYGFELARNISTVHISGKLCKYGADQSHRCWVM